jgi:catechol 2,3-dioxygenase-like lactoylglutathione lyase family enzyme
LKQPRITSQAPVLLTQDVPRAIQYWVEKLGFETTGSWGEPPEFAILKRDSARIMLGKAKADHVIIPHWQARPGTWNAYFWIDNAKAMFAELTQRGAIIDYGLELKDYGVLEFGIHDLDGQDIGFGEVVE